MMVNLAAALASKNEESLLLTWIPRRPLLSGSVTTIEKGLLSVFTEGLKVCFRH